MSAFNRPHCINDSHVASKVVAVLVLFFRFHFLQHLGQRVHAAQEPLLQRVLAEGDEGRLFAVQFFFQERGQFVFIQQAVHQLGVHGVLRASYRQVVGECIQRARLQASSTFHVRGHVLPKARKQSPGLFLVGVAEILAQEGFHRALVFVSRATHHGDVDAQLFEHAWVEHALAAEAVEGHPTLGVQVHLICRGIEVKCTLAHALAPGHNELAAVLKDGQSGAQVFHHAGHHGHVGHVEQHTLDLVVARSAVKRVQNLVQAQLHAGLQATTKAE